MGLFWRSWPSGAKAETGAKGETKESTGMMFPKFLMPDMRLLRPLLHFFLTFLFFWHRLNIHLQTEELNIITVSGETPLIIGRLQAPEPP